MSGRKPRAPESLDAAGKRLWTSVTSDYELSPGELETLRQACRVADLLTRIDTALVGDDLTVEGSKGQLRAHPLLAAAADQRRVLDGLLRSLALPMPDEQEGRRQSPSARAAAQARWRSEARGRHQDGEMA